MKGLEALKIVRDYVRQHEFTPVTMETPLSSKRLMYLHPEKLILLSKGKDYLYVMNPWGPYKHNGIPKDRVLMMDYLFTIEEVIRLSKQPEKFIETLTTVPVSHPQMYYIYIDGELTYQNLSGRRWTKMRDWYLYERKMGKIDFNHLKTVDPEGKATDFLFNQNDPGVEAVRALAKAKRENRVQSPM